MDNQRDNSTEIEREERIRERAHNLWEQAGRPEGTEKEHWDRALSELDGEAQTGPASTQDGNGARNTAAP